MLGTHQDGAASGNGVGSGAEAAGDPARRSRVGASAAGSGGQGEGTTAPGEGQPTQGLVAAATQALAPLAAGEGVALEDEFAMTPALARLPVEVDIVVPVRPFRVRNVLALEPGQVIASQWEQGNDVPLTAGDVRLAWTEFEVIDQQLAVRVTRLP